MTLARVPSAPRSPPTAPRPCSPCPGSHMTFVYDIDATTGAWTETEAIPEGGVAVAVSGDTAIVGCSAFRSTGVPGPASPRLGPHARGLGLGGHLAGPGPTAVGRLVDRHLRLGGGHLRRHDRGRLLGQRRGLRVRAQPRRAQRVGLRGKALLRRRGDPLRELGGRGRRRGPGGRATGPGDRSGLRLRAPGRERPLGPDGQAARERRGSGRLVRHLVEPLGNHGAGRRWRGLLAVFNPPGAAYVFERAGSAWQEVAKLSASTPGGGEAFGHRVALDSDTAVVADPTVLAAGVFKRNHGGVDAWGEVAVLPASEAGAVAVASTRSPCWTRSPTCPSLSARSAASRSTLRRGCSTAPSSTTTGSSPSTRQAAFPR